MDKKQNDQFVRVTNAIAKYLKFYGWQHLVIGGCEVRQQPDAPKYNYEFVVKFTGSRRDK